MRSELVSMATDSSHMFINGKLVLPLFLDCFSSDLFIFAAKEECITAWIAWTSSNFGHIPRPTAELAALDHLEKGPIDL